MSIEESKAEILKRHRANLARRHEEELADFDEAFEMVRAELAEAEKPKLRDLDFGIDHAGQRWIHIDGRIRWIESSSVTRSSLSDEDFDPGKKWNLRDVLDDLTALSGDMEEFETVSLSGAKTTWKIDGDGDLLISLESNPQQTVVQKSDLAETVLKLRQMAATAKRKE